MTDCEKIERTRHALEHAFDTMLQDGHGLYYSSLHMDTMAPWENEDFSGNVLYSLIPGYENLSHADFMNYENSGMVMGTYLSALTFKCLATGEAIWAEKAHAVFDGIVKNYTMSQTIAPGFFCKPWGGHVTTETSSDQFIYVMCGLDDFSQIAPEETRRVIDGMIVSMSRFWVDHGYDWNYYGQRLHWPETRFISFMALALKHGGGQVFQREMERLTSLFETQGRSPFNSTIPECLHTNEDGSQCLYLTPESALSSYLSVEAAMVLEKRPSFVELCRRCLEYGKMGLAGDGTSYSMLVRHSSNEEFAEIPQEETHYEATRYQSPIFGLYGPYRKGGMQTTMFARFALAFTRFDAKGDGVRLAEEMLSSVGMEHMTWYEDPYAIFPEEIQWMTRTVSVDAMAHWLWCYWKLRLVKNGKEDCK